MQVTRFSVWQENSLVCMARIVGADAALVTQGSVATITLRVEDKNTGAVVIQDQELDAEDVITDGGFTTPPWGNRSQAGNFKHTLPTSATDTPTSKLVVRYRFVMQNFDAFDVKYQGEVSDVFAEEC